MLGEFIDIMANIEFGLLIAICIDALLLFTIAATSNSKLNIMSYIIGIVLLALLTFQMSGLIGACKMSNTASGLNEIIGVVSPTLNKYVSSATNHEIGWFVFRRIVWSLLFIVAASLGIIATMDKKHNTTRRSAHERRPTSRRYDSTISRRRRY